MSENDDAVERAARLVREYVETGGQDHGVIVADRLLTAALAARGDAATPIVTDRQELDACRAADEAQGMEMGAAEPWRHAYLRALGIEVEGGEQP